MSRVKRALKYNIEREATIRHGDYQDMTDEELLRKVRELLPGRWTQGANALNALGLPTSPMSDSAVQFCLRGACIKALQPSPHVLVCDLHLERSRISKQIAHALGFEASSWLVQWNDTQGRTEADVLARIDHYIRKEEHSGQKNLGKDDARRKGAGNPHPSG
jgi:hypothetical protein